MKYLTDVHKISLTNSWEEQAFNKTRNYSIMWKCTLNFTHAGQEIWEQRTKNVFMPLREVQMSLSGFSRNHRHHDISL